MSVNHFGKLNWTCYAIGLPKVDRQGLRLCETIFIHKIGETKQECCKIDYPNFFIKKNTTRRSAYNAATINIHTKRNS